MGAVPEKPSRLESDLERLRDTWESGARRDPHWVVLTDPARSHGRWSGEEFFESGREDARRLFERLRDLNTPGDASRALDFGCGLGRISAALADRFQEVDGVDISESMAKQARSLHADRKGLNFHVNVAADLSMFQSGSYDLVHSLMTLQHIPRTLALGYIRDFVRLLNAKGVAAFQVPTSLRYTPGGLLRRLVPRIARRLYWRTRGLEPIEMHTLSVRHVEEVVFASGGVVLAQYPDYSAGQHYRSVFYFVVKGG